MTDSAVLDEPRIEAPPEPAIAAPAAETPKPRKRRKRFLATIRFNGSTYLVLACALLLAWGMIEAAAWVGTGTPEGMFLFVLAGGMLAAAAKSALDILNWAEATRQATHVEKLRAVRRVFQRARVVREHAVIDWRRLHTVLVDSLSGQPQAIRLFKGHDETDRHAERLVRKALSEEVWIGLDGVDAVRRFQAEIAEVDYDGIATETEFAAAFNRRMNSLRRELALAALGIQLD